MLVCINVSVFQLSVYLNFKNNFFAVLAILSYLGFNDMSDLGILFSYYVSELLYTVLVLNKLYYYYLSVRLRSSPAERPQVAHQLGAHQGELLQVQALQLRSLLRLSRQEPHRCGA